MANNIMKFKNNIDIYIEQRFQNVCHRFIGVPCTSVTRHAIKEALKAEAYAISQELHYPVQCPDFTVDIEFE